MQNRYPLWKNILLISLLLIAIVYAMPSLFGDDPSIQISSNPNTNTDQAIGNDHNNHIASKIRQILANSKMVYSRIEELSDGVLVRFSDADTQIKARDILRTGLGEEYLIALNLASRTPRWLRFLGAEPIKLGLDLRGGVHFLLAADFGDMIIKREDGDIRSIIGGLREIGVRYLSVERVRPSGVVITFHDIENLNRGEVELGRRLQDYKFNRITSGGECKLRLEVSENAIAKITDYAIDQTVNILGKRVNELGISEAIVQRQGQKYVSVDLPGIQDTVRAKEIIGKTATLRFHLVDTDNDMELAMAGDMPLGSKFYEYEGRKILLKDQVVLQGNSITHAMAAISSYGKPAVKVRLGGGGEQIFHRITSDNIGNPLAIVYVETKQEEREINGEVEIVNRPIEKVISVAMIQSALGDQFEISGLSSDRYAQDLALLLRSGALVAPVSVVQETTVGPSMGKANIDKGILSIVIGYLVVMLFMASYYRLFGVISNVALLCNLIFMMAILSILGATLTLPGIAGMVLTVGLAVDANVLIYERIREELRNGSTLQTSIYNGYQRAFATIVDANVATLIVALVLFALGSGAVKGFAVVLIIGLATSMLTSIVYTRMIVGWVYGGRNVKKLSIGV